MGSCGAGSRWSKPKELFVKMSSVVIAQFGQILLGPALTVGDNEPVNKTLFNNFTRESRYGRRTIPVKKGRPHELHKSEVCLIFEDGLSQLPDFLL